MDGDRLLSRERQKTSLKFRLRAVFLWAGISKCGLGDPGAVDWVLLCIFLLPSFLSLSLWWFFGFPISFFDRNNGGAGPINENGETGSICLLYAWIQMNGSRPGDLGTTGRAHFISFRV